MPPRRRRSSADLSKLRIARLAAKAGTTPRSLASAVRDTLAGWRELPAGRDHADQLRVMLAAGLAEALAQAEARGELEQLQAQAVVEVLRAGVEALDTTLEDW